MSIATLDDVQRQIALDDQGKVDFWTRSSRMSMDDQTGLFQFDTKEPRRSSESANIVDLDGRLLNATDHGMSQICSRVMGVPSRWFQQNPHALQAQIFNHWIAKSPSNYLVRTRNNTIRALLTSEYVPMNNSNVMEATLRNLPKQFTSAVHRFYFDDLIFFLKLTFPDLTREWVRPSTGQKEMFRVGVMISNSETGCASIRVEPFIFRQACTNDLIVEQDRAWRKQHRWVSQPVLNQLVEVALRRALQDGADAMEDFERLDAERVKEPEKTIEYLLRTGKFAEKYVDMTKKAFHEEPGDTRFAVVNAITRMGRLLPEPQRIEFERYAGKVMRQRHWLN